MRLFIRHRVKHGERVPRAWITKLEYDLKRGWAFRLPLPKITWERDLIADVEEYGWYLPILLVTFSIHGFKVQWFYEFDRAFMGEPNITRRELVYK